MDAALKAIADPSRRRILTLVRDEERTSGEIASHFDVTRPAISQHLKVLKEAGLVNERRDGVRRLYSVRTEGLGDVRRFVEEFWSKGLVRLKEIAEAEEQKTAGGLGRTPDKRRRDDNDA
jgi:DNA-binding transcriptional ArsR family regulator